MNWILEEIRRKRHNQVILGLYVMYLIFLYGFSFPYHEFVAYVLLAGEVTLCLVVIRRSSQRIKRIEERKKQLTNLNHIMQAITIYNEDNEIVIHREIEKTVKTVNDHEHKEALEILLNQKQRAELNHGKSHFIVSGLALENFNSYIKNSLHR